MVDRNRLMLAIGAGLAPRGGGLEILRSMDESEDREASRKEQLKTSIALKGLQMEGLDPESRSKFADVLSQQGLLPEGFDLKFLDEEPERDVSPFINIETKTGETVSVRRESERADELVSAGGRVVPTSSPKMKFDKEDALLETQQILDEDGELSLPDQRRRELAIAQLRTPQVIQRRDPESGQLITTLVNPQLPAFVEGTTVPVPPESTQTEQRLATQPPLVQREKPPEGPTPIEKRNARERIKSLDLAIEQSRKIMNFIGDNPDAVGARGIVEQGIRAGRSILTGRGGKSPRATLAADMQFLRGQIAPFAADKGNLNQTEQAMLERVLVGLNTFDTPEDAIVVQQLVQEFLGSIKKRAQVTAGELIEVEYGEDENGNQMFRKKGTIEWKPLPGAN